MIRLGVVGYGLRIAHLATETLAKLGDDVRIVGVVDHDEASVRARMREKDCSDVTFYPTMQEMARRANLDGWMIGTRCNTHTPLAIEAAAYDIPLFLEKPVAVDIDQAEQLEAAFEDSRCEVVVSFPLRVSPICEQMREMIADGAVGTPQHIHAVNNVPYGYYYWQNEGYRNYNVTRGLFLQKATHDFDYISYLMGSPITHVAAMANYGRVYGGDKPAGLVCSRCDDRDTCRESPGNRRKQGQTSPEMTGDHLCLFSIDCGSQTDTNEDCASVLLRFADGSHGVYSQVFFSRYTAAARGATVSGYDGTLSFDWYKGEVHRVRHFSPFADTSRAEQGAAHFGGDDSLMRNFIDVIHGHGKSKTPIQVGIQSVYACLAAKESAVNQTFTAIRQVGQSPVIAAARRSV